MLSTPQITQAVGLNWGSAFCSVVGPSQRAKQADLDSGMGQGQADILSHGEDAEGGIAGSLASLGPLGVILLKLAASHWWQEVKVLYLKGR